ncbi:hypothetical protein LINGRAHAP2_LOCUS23141, partial [Linum grandiflorum]
QKKSYSLLKFPILPKQDFIDSFFFSFTFFRISEFFIQLSKFSTSHNYDLNEM